MTWWHDDMMTWWHDDMIQCLLSHAQIWVRSITWFWAPKFETMTHLLTRVKSRDASASKKLDNLKYRAAKIVTGALKFTSQDNLFKELGWETTTQRIKLLCLTQFHKIMHRQTTPLIQDCLPPLLNARYPTKRTFEHYPCKKNILWEVFLSSCNQTMGWPQKGLKGTGPHWV